MARSLCIILPEFLQSFKLRTAPASEFFVQPAEASSIHACLCHVYSCTELSVKGGFFIRLL